MTAADMLSLLGLYLEDQDDTEFSAADKLLLLNRGQERVIRLANRHLLRELQSSDLAQALTGGAYALSGLTFVPQNGAHGLIGVRLTAGDFCRLISWEEYKKGVDRSVSYVSSDPIYYVLGGSIYPLPADTTLDIYYLGQPTAITALIACELNAALHDAVVEFGAYYGWRAGNRIDGTKADRYKTDAVEGIAQLNIDFAPTDSMQEGIDPDVDKDDGVWHTFMEAYEV